MSVTGPVTVRLIVACAAALHGVSSVQIMARRRTASVIWPRHLSAWAARQMTTRSLPEIGRALGGRDHTTVLHSCRVAETEMARPGEAGETARDQAAQLMAAVRARITLADRPAAAALPGEIDALEVADRILDRGDAGAVSVDEIMALAGAVVDHHRLTALRDPSAASADAIAAMRAFVTVTEQLAGPLDPPVRAALAAEQRRAYRDLKDIILTTKEPTHAA